MNELFVSFNLAIKVVEAYFKKIIIYINKSESLNWMFWTNFEIGATTLIDFNKKRRKKKNMEKKSENQKVEGFQVLQQ